MDKIRAIRQGILNGRLGDSATAAEAELFAIFAVLKKIQAQQYTGRYGDEKARVLIMSDCLAGLRVIEKVWRGKRNVYRKLRNGAILEAITNVRETLGTVIFMWIPSHVGITPNVLADNIAAQVQEEAPEGMIAGLVSKQVTSRPVIYSRKVRGQVELADNPIYQEARRRGKKFIRDLHRPPAGGSSCESGIAKGMLEGDDDEEARESDLELDIERQEGKRELEKIVYGLRNGEIVNGCRGCQRQEEGESIHHVLSGGCEGIGRSRNNKYKAEIRRALGKCKNLMNSINNVQGLEQVDKALCALENPRRHVDANIKEEEELALKQIISGIIPEWQESDMKKKTG
eukprot:5357135-Pleurochrysis_carterae.AAC.1